MQTVPQTAIMAEPSPLLGHFWQSSDIELSMPGIADILAISEAMPLACTADRFKLKVTRTASNSVNNRRAEKWIITGAILGTVRGANKVMALRPCDAHALFASLWRETPWNFLTVCNLPPLPAEDIEVSHLGLNLHGGTPWIAVLSIPHSQDLSLPLLLCSLFRGERRRMKRWIK